MKVKLGALKRSTIFQGSLEVSDAGYRNNTWTYFKNKFNSFLSTNLGVFSIMNTKIMHN